MRLSDKAYHLIRLEIITLELAALSAIDEQALGEGLWLGRTPSREALHQLAADGLVYSAPGEGCLSPTSVSPTCREYPSCA